MTPPAATADTLTLSDLLVELRALRAEVAAQTAPWPAWMSLEVAARYTSLSTKSLRRLIGRGELTPRRVLRGKLLLSKTEIDALMRA